MKLMLPAVLLLGLATLLQATGKHKAPGPPAQGRTVRLVLDPSVQPQVAPRGASASANMSLSPWTYRESCVGSRLPAKISYAECLTSGCVSLQGGGEDASLMAKPIYYQVLVLHRVQRPKLARKRGKRPRTKYYFRLGTEVIPVGCTCVRPSVVPQQ